MWFAIYFIKVKFTPFISSDCEFYCEKWFEDMFYDILEQQRPLCIATPKIVATFKRKRKKKYLLQPIIK